jgi:hypothetical protein
VTAIEWGRLKVSADGALYLFGCTIVIGCLAGAAIDATRPPPASDYTALPVAPESSIPMAGIGLECHRTEGCPVILYPRDAGVSVVMPCDVERPASGICWRAARTDVWR